MAEVTARDAKLIQYLNEAYGKEKELETALQAHISMTTRAPYKKRLQQHLKETKAHARQVSKRIRELGGKAEAGPGPEVVAEATSAVTGVASKAVAAAKGPLHAIRGAGEAEKMLKNARTEYSEEAQEIAFYTSIETLAESLGDRDTAKLAKSIRREEERMASFLERQISTLTKAVIQEEIPAKERRASRNGARASSRSRARSSNGSRSASSRSGSSARSSASRSGSSRSSSSRSGSSRSGSSRSGSSRSGSSRSSSGSGASRSSSGSGSSRSSSSRSGSSRSGSSARSSSSRGGSSRGGSSSRSGSSRSGSSRSRS